jgi:hypothetical protein
MKRILCFIITLALITSTGAVAFAKPVKYQEKSHKNYSEDQEFKYDDSKVIKYGRYQLPINPITKGMGAIVTYDKTTAVLTITKDTTTIVIDFKNKKVTVNGTEDTKSGIFTAKNSKKMTVLVKYVAQVLGVRVKIDKDKIEVIGSTLDAPTNIKITPYGTNVVANTLNSTTQFMEVTADIKQGQATGGKAELYVKTKLVATDAVITATNSAIQFTTSDLTPTNEELKALVPEGGEVTIKLYDASGKVVTSKVELKLNVDYVAPTLTSFTSAVYMQEEGKLYLAVTGAGNIKDAVDVTKLFLYDATLARSYQLTGSKNGSLGFVNSATSLKIYLSEADRLGLTGFGTSTMTLTIVTGALITDTAGNTSPVLVAPITLPVTIIK